MIIRHPQGWLSERSTLFSRPLDPDARAAVRFKDVLIAGTLLTGAASVAGEKFLRREHPDGLPITRDAELATEAPPSADPYRRYFRVLGIANRGLCAGAIATTPFITLTRSRASSRWSDDVGPARGDCCRARAGDTSGLATSWLANFIRAAVPGREQGL
jgi:hypothetical protein